MNRCQYCNGSIEPFGTCERRDCPGQVHREGPDRATLEHYHATRNYPPPTAMVSDCGDALRDWHTGEGACPASCAEGCLVEDDGICPHGQPSFAIRLGLVE